MNVWSQVCDAPLDVQIAAFKVSRALAAATLNAEVAAGPAAVRQRALQPLKFRHFERCATHIARQLREVCAARGTADDDGSEQPSDLAAPAKGANPPGNSDNNAWLMNGSRGTGGSRLRRGGNAGQGMPNAGEASPFADLQAALGPDPGTRPPLAVLLLVGRQYEPILRRLWKDPTSAVWNSQVCA